MTSLIKTYCGTPQVISLLDGMMNDVNLSEDLHKRFEHSERYNQLPVKCYFNIISRANWRISTNSFADSKFVLPAPLRSSLDIFNEFYESVHQNRKLLILYTEGAVSVQISVSQHFSLDTILSPYQFAILALFQEQKVVKFSEMQRMLAISSATIKDSLKPLVFSRYRIVARITQSASTKVSGETKAGKGEIVESDEFVFQAKSANSGKWPSKIYYNSLSQKQQTKEQEGRRQAIESDRRYQLDATIVRIMKSRRSISISDLICEAQRMLASRFLPEIKFIKERVRCLVEQEYIGPDRIDGRVYVYIA